MGRLIDADDFGNRMYHEAFEKDSDLQKWDSGCWIRYKLFENVLREQPTVQPDHTADVSKKVERTDETAQNVSDSDLISRKAVTDALAKFVPYAICDESTESYANGLTDAYNLILQLPSAQPEQRWIPCRKKLPEKDDYYLVQALMNNDIFVASWQGCYWNIKTPIVAWMTLPEPYKGGDAE